MIQKDIFFLPDISGFTKFIKDTEKQHSRHIISELLELIIETNKQFFELVEIEGDAVFFYAKANTLTQKELISAIETTYIKFHTHLKDYDSHRICPCGACKSASTLDLKFINHFGDLDFIEIQGREKPFGEDVILAHRLMKNSIDSNAYMLFSGIENLEKESPYKSNLDWIETSSSIDNSEVPYQFHTLSYLDDFIKQQPRKINPRPSTNYVSNSIIFDIDHIDLFTIITDFNKRLLWNTGANDIRYDESKINQVGEKHVCVIKQDEIEISSIYSDFGDDKLVYGETTKSAKPISELTSFFVVEPHENGSKLTIFVYFTLNGFFLKLLTPLVKMKSKGSIKQLFTGLGNLINQ